MGFGLARRRRDGGVDLHLEEVHRTILGDVLGQLRDALVADSDDPMLARLFPPAYADDEEKEEGFRALARDELLEHRLEAIDAVESTLDAASIDAEQADAWLRTLNALRLVLGTRLDIRDDDERRIDEDDPDAPAWILYELLSALVDDLVGALEP